MKQFQSKTNGDGAFNNADQDTPYPPFAKAKEAGSGLVHSVSMSSLFHSHMTLLRPRESTPSDALSGFSNLRGSNEQISWRYRMVFIFRILGFCLGPANIWRFPRQALLYGNASYLYLYTIYIFLFGTSLLFFELSLGQYLYKGFGKIFTFSPIMEGISTSMVFNSVIVNMLCNMVGTYSCLYMFSSFYKNMPHSYCSQQVKTDVCKNNFTNYTQSPEYTYFHDHIVRGIDIHGDKGMNWRNSGVLVFIWIVVCFMIVFGILKYYVISVIYCAFTVFSLIFTMAVISSLDGATFGLHHMFNPKKNDFLEIKTWIYPMEQSLITLSLGVGPLLNFWSVSKTPTWSHIDCVIINVAAYICSVLSGIILFNGVGVLAISKGETIDNILDATNKRYVTSVHIILTQVLNKTTSGLSNFTIFIFYLLLFCSSIFNALEYTQVFLLYLNTYIKLKKIPRVVIIILVCFIAFIMTTITASKIGYPLMMAINKIFIAPALMITLCCELIATSYFYGMKYLCDDIEFLLGYVPNYYYQVMWLLLPIVFVVTSIMSLYLKINIIEDIYDFIALGMIVIFSMLPILLFALFHFIKGVKNKNVHRIINNRETSFELHSHSSVN